MADIFWKGTDESSPTDWNTAANWSGGAVPTATDNVRLIAAYSNDLAGYDASGVALSDFIVMPGYTGKIGTASADLQISCSYFEYSGEGEAYIDLGSSSVSPRIRTTATAPGTGENGLYLIGSALDVLSIESGSVGLAAIHGQTATATTVRQFGGTFNCGTAASVTTFNGHGGSAAIDCNLTTCNLFGGTATTGEEMTIGTLTIEAGTLVANSSGTITTVNIDGGELDLSRTGVARVVTTLNLNPGGSLRYDPTSVTLSTINEADAPIVITTSRM